MGMERLLLLWDDLDDLLGAARHVALTAAAGLVQAGRDAADALLAGLIATALQARRLAAGTLASSAPEP